MSNKTISVQDVDKYYELQIDEQSIIEKLEKLERMAKDPKTISCLTFDFAEDDEENRRIHNAGVYATQLYIEDEKEQIDSIKFFIQILSNRLLKVRRELVKLEQKG